MIWIELVLATLERVQTFAWVVIIVAIVGAFFASICAHDKRSFPILNGGEERAEEKALMYERIRKKFLCGLLVAPVLLVPSAEDIFRIRIGLIKFQLASPENIQKGAETIERLGKKLECKYLGCEDEAKRSGNEQGK